MTTLMTMVHVSDMERSIAFYRDTLGLALTFQSPEWSQFDVEGSALALHGGAARSPAVDRSVLPAGVAEIGLNFLDLATTCAELKAQGVTFIMEPTDRMDEGIKLARILDPDGMAVTLAQSVSR